MLAAHALLQYTSADVKVKISSLGPLKLIQEREFPVWYYMVLCEGRKKEIGRKQETERLTKKNTSKERKAKSALIHKADLVMFIYWGKWAHYLQTHSRFNPSSLPYWHLTWVNAIVNDIHWPCAHLLPLLAIWFPVLEEDLLLMIQPNPPAIHLKYISDHTAGICLLSRQVTNADLKVQYIDKPLYLLCC